MTVHDEEGMDLLEILDKCDLTSRYYRNVRPGEGEQPEGWQGLPHPLCLLWGEVSAEYVYGSDDDEEEEHSEGDGDGINEQYDDEHSSGSETDSTYSR